MKNKTVLLKALFFSIVMCLLLSVTTLAASVKVTGTSSNPTIVDTLDGVPAKYIKGLNNSNSGSFSCAGYVNAYYKKIFSTSVSNLLTGKSPVSSNKKFYFQQINSGFRKGDIVYQLNSSGTGHWMIAKAVSGKNITVIEQNWKWKNGSVTFGSKNRVVTYGKTKGLKIFRLRLSEKGIISSLTSNSKGDIIIKWKKNNTVSGYQLQYATKSDFSNAKTINITNPNVVSQTINNLKNKTTYFTRVQPYRKYNGLLYYGTWSSAKKITTKIIQSNSYIFYSNGFGLDEGSVNYQIKNQILLLNNKKFKNNYVNSPFIYNCEGTGKTKGEFETALQQAFSKASSNDVGIVIIEAHGARGCFSLGERGRLYTYSSLLKKLKATKCGTFIILLGPCHSGSIKNDLSSLSSSERKRFNVITSCSADLSGQRYGGWYSFFDRGIYGGLEKVSKYCRADWNKNGEVTLKELYDYIEIYIKGKLLEWGYDSNGDYWDNSDQDPWFYADNKNFVFFK